MNGKAKEHPVPDAAAMARLLEAHGDDLAGLVLRLVWRAGLSRAEICALTWDRVDLDGGLLRLPDREIPLEAETVRFLRRWAEHRAGQEHVALSRRRQPLQPSGVFAPARRALDEGGLKHVRVYDLRHDYVRRQFETRSWHEALRVTGLTVSTYRSALAGTLERAPAPPEPSGAKRNGADEEYKLWRILQAERDTPAGIALWLLNQQGLNLKEICALTWEQVDLAAEVLRLPDREAALTAGTRRVLAGAYALRRPEDDPHVILTVSSRRPMTSARLTALIRDMLIRGGLGERKPMDFRKRPDGEDALRLLELARAQGSITRAEAAERLGVSMGQAYNRLRRLEEDGSLILLKNRWWPAGAAVPREGRDEAILRRIAGRGPATSGEIAEYLGVARRTAAERLGGMVRAGDLFRQGAERRYCLTEQGEKKVTKS